HKYENLRKIFNTAFFAFICIIFIFIAPMGVNLMGERTVGRVGNDFIPIRELRNLEENLRNRYKNRLEQADEETALKIQNQIQSMALEKLVTDYIINYALRKEGLFITDQELFKSLTSIPIFQEEGRFLKSRYKGFLKSQNLNASRFEESIRRSQLVLNWQSAFSQAILSNKLEKEKNMARYQYKINIRYAELNAGKVAEEELEPFVKSQNKKEINNFLKQAQVSWKKTGLFSILLPLGVSIAQSESFMDAIINQLPKTGLISKLIRDDNKVYVIEILSFSKDKLSSADKKLESLISQNFDKSNRLFNSWLNLQKEHIEIEIKPDLL
ncbi:MAG: SurA N-terminal domain-containing protein, partial [Bdellovibrionaceae bacterium]|nr:SurA N-terminal domain-containing protein [Pseudobdellovibrionaceae bacterium]